MGWTDDFLAGIGAELNTAGVGDFPASATSTAVVRIGGFQPEVDISTSLQVYSAQDDVAQSDVMQPVQFSFRGTTDPRTVHDLSDRVFDLYHGRVRFSLNGIFVSWCRRASTIPNGTDQNGRLLQTDNCYFSASRPNAYRTA